MSLAKSVFDLQQVDLLIQGHTKQMQEINLRLSHNDAYERARESLVSARDSQKQRERQYKELDAEAEELRNSVKQINDKLYGGKVKNPKELVGYEAEAGIVKGNLAKKDDTLLDLMESIDLAKIEIAKLQDAYATAESDWRNQTAELQTNAHKLKEDLAELEKKREGLQAALDKDTLLMYEGIRGRKGQAVVKVEQGRCLGCRVSLSISELQRVRGSAIITCSNCGRILFLS